MTWITSLGLVAGALTTVAFVPQVFRAWRTRSARDLSLATLVVLAVGVSLWIVYGVLERSFPVVAANSLTLVLVGAILGAKIRYG